MAQSGTEPVAVSFYVREIGAILIGALAVILLLALSSYVPSDRVSDVVDDRFANIIGSIGAVIAFGCYWAIGIVAYLLPLGLFAMCAPILRWPTDSLDWVSAGCRVGGVVLLILSATVFATLHISGISKLPMDSGGYIGGTLVLFTIDYVKTAGLSILSFVIVLIALQLVFAFSWLNVLEWTGRWVTKSSVGLLNVLKWFYRSTISCYRAINQLFESESDRSTVRSQQAGTVTPPRIAPTVGIEPAELKERESLDELGASPIDNTSDEFTVPASDVTLDGSGTGFWRSCCGCTTEK